MNNYFSASAFVIKIKQPTLYPD